MTEATSATGLFEAKTHFPRIVDDLANGRRRAVPVLRRRKPMPYIVSDTILPAYALPGQHA